MSPWIESSICKKGMVTGTFVDWASQYPGQYQYYKFTCNTFILNKMANYIKTWLKTIITYHCESCLLSALTIETLSCGPYTTSKMQSPALSFCNNFLVHIKNLTYYLCCLEMETTIILLLSIMYTVFYLKVAILKYFPSHFSVWVWYILFSRDRCLHIQCLCKIN